MKPFMSLSALVLLLTGCPTPVDQQQPPAPSAPQGNNPPPVGGPQGNSPPPVGGPQANNAPAMGPPPLGNNSPPMGFPPGGPTDNQGPPPSAPMDAAPSDQAPAGQAWPNPTSSSTVADQIEWMPIDPNKPDGPMMAPVTGNPKQGAFSALVKLPAGHASPLHSHTATMHGVVISGTVKNGRTAEDAVTLTAGTKWTQPGGEAHYTACGADSECIFVGRMEGAMAMTPAESPVATSSQVVTKASEIEYKPFYPNAPAGPATHALSGNMKGGGFHALIRFPAGATTPKHSHSNSYSAAVISGSISHGDGKTMTPGSLWEQKGGKVHTTVCGSDEPCVFFASMNGELDFISDGPPPQ